MLYWELFLGYYYHHFRFGIIPKFQPTTFPGRPLASYPRFVIVQRYTRLIKLRIVWLCHFRAKPGAESAQLQIYWCWEVRFCTLYSHGWCYVWSGKSLGCSHYVQESRFYERMSRPFPQFTDIVSHISTLGNKHIYHWRSILQHVRQPDYRPLWS